MLLKWSLHIVNCKNHILFSNACKKPHEHCKHLHPKTTHEKNCIERERKRKQVQDAKDNNSNHFKLESDKTIQILCENPKFQHELIFSKSNKWDD